MLESPFAAKQENEDETSAPDSTKADEDSVLSIRPDVASILKLTKDNVDKVLDEVRPYLIADGGNVAVASIDTTTRNIVLSLQGACGSCPSSTTTMRMGIERVLRENFADLGTVTAAELVAPEQVLTVGMIEEALAQILPAIKGMGGSVVVQSVDAEAGTVNLKYKGPPRLRQGIELVLKDVKLVKQVLMEDLV